jgi:hypothetical protein
LPLSATGDSNVYVAANAAAKKQTTNTTIRSASSSHRCVTSPQSFGALPSAAIIARDRPACDAPVRRRPVTYRTRAPIKKRPALGTDRHNAQLRLRRRTA